MRIITFAINEFSLEKYLLSLTELGIMLLVYLCEVISNL